MPGVSTDFENVKVRRKSPFYSILDISKYAKKCPNGGIMFVKSGKNNLTKKSLCFR